MYVKHRRYRTKSKQHRRRCRCRRRRFSVTDDAIVLVNIGVADVVLVVNHSCCCTY